MDFEQKSHVARGLGLNSTTSKHPSWGKAPCALRRPTIIIDVYFLLAFFTIDFVLNILAHSPQLVVMPAVAQFRQLRWSCKRCKWRVPLHHDTSQCAKTDRSWIRLPDHE